MMRTVVATVIICIVLSGAQVDAADCCSSYTDLFGKYHPTQLCEDYCCLNPSLSDYVKCCSDPAWQAPSDKRTDECLATWISEHIWVPIVAGVVFLVIIVALCTCCCCCGCCACCRRQPAPVIVHTPGGPQTTVAMQQTMANNPAHYGYDQ